MAAHQSTDGSTPKHSFDILAHPPAAGLPDSGMATLQHRPNLTLVQRHGEVFLQVEEDAPYTAKSGRRFSRPKKTGFSFSPLRSRDLHNHQSSYVNSLWHTHALSGDGNPLFNVNLILSLRTVSHLAMHGWSKCVMLIRCILDAVPIVYH